MLFTSPAPCPRAAALLPAASALLLLQGLSGAEQGQEQRDPATCTGDSVALVCEGCGCVSCPPQGARGQRRVPLPVDARAVKVTSAEWQVPGRLPGARAVPHEPVGVLLACHCPLALAGRSWAGGNEALPVKLMNF